MHPGVLVRYKKSLCRGADKHHGETTNLHTTQSATNYIIVYRSLIRAEVCFVALSSSQYFVGLIGHLCFVLDGA